jgi:S-adenosylmethionine:tRNA ribosyltransferase-isomerase
MLKLSDYDYFLPPELVAQNPVQPRDSCRLLILDRKTGSIEHDVFRNIGNYLSPKDLLVLNNTRVMPARVFGRKETGGRVELLLLNEKEKNLWETLVRPGRRLPTGTKILLYYEEGKGDEKTQSDSSLPISSRGQALSEEKRAALTPISAEVVARNGNGTRIVQFSGCDNIRDLLPVVGEVPLPPYINQSNSSPEEYQTIYSREEGSVAAPTAGLHFTEDLMEELKAEGVNFSEITLHIGWGTFRPVHSENILDHQMEKEWYSISKSAAEQINQGKQEGKRIAAVGTTACRVLENFPFGEISAGSGFTNLFIYPGFEFKQVDSLITNFHLPKSTLLMLVSAFAGHEKILDAYKEAIRLHYRFYSFGDAMLIL